MRLPSRDQDGSRSSKGPDGDRAKTRCHRRSSRRCATHRRAYPWNATRRSSGAHAGWRASRNSSVTRFAATAARRQRPQAALQIDHQRAPVGRQRRRHGCAFAQVDRNRLWWERLLRKQGEGAGDRNPVVFMTTGNYHFHGFGMIRSCGPGGPASLSRDRRRTDRYRRRHRVDRCSQRERRRHRSR